MTTGSDPLTLTVSLDRDLHRDGPLFPMNHWGERYLETGVSNEYMIRMVVQWASDRGTDRALFMAADLVTRFGHRRHVALLHRHRAAKSRFGQKVIENTDFDLRLCCIRDPKDNTCYSGASVGRRQPYWSRTSPRFLPGDN